MRECPHFLTHAIGELMCSKRVLSSVAKHLLNLRVALSTAHTGWIDDMLELGGLACLAAQLSRVCLAERQLGDVHEQIVTEVSKCLRVILNTDVSLATIHLGPAVRTDEQNGVARILGHPELIRDTVICLKTPSPKLRIIIAELLAALVVVSHTANQHPMLDGMADASHGLGETYRFDWLVSSLARGDGDDEEWHWQESVIVLLNTLIAAEEDVEARCALRGELQRRGLVDRLSVS